MSPLFHTRTARVSELPLLGLGVLVKLVDVYQNIDKNKNEIKAGIYEEMYRNLFHE